jgi:cobalt/nickel transport system ATP-binding protein
MTVIRHTGVGSERCAGFEARGDELIHVDCISHVYPDGSTGIHDMCFRVLSGEIVALCGPNGSGKSTLLEHLNGLLSPSVGHVAVFGKTIGKSRDDLWRDIGIVFQRSDDQLFAPTVLDDVMFGLLNLGKDPGEAQRIASESLQQVGAGHLVHKIPNYLSGGEKRMVAIAGILAMRPSVIAMDEPTSDLDPRHGAIIETLIRRLRDEYRISVVIATHDLDLAARIADRVCLVKGGSIIAEGTPAEVFYDGELMDEAGLDKPVVVRIFEEYAKAAGRTIPGNPVAPGDLVRLLTGG